MPFSVPAHLSQFNIPLAEFSASKPGFTDFFAGGHVFSQGQSGEYRVLLLQRAPTDSLPHFWEGPGGGVDPQDASILAGAAREVFEESGLRVARFVDLIAVNEWTRLKPDKLHVVGKFNFLVEVDGQATGEPMQVKLEETEHQAFAWATEEEVREGVEERGKYRFVSVEGQHILKAFGMVKGT